MMVFSSSSNDPIASVRPRGLCDPTIFIACDCTAFTAREMTLRSVGFLRGGMVG